MKQGEIKKGFKAFRNNVYNNRNSMRSLRRCESCSYYYSDNDSSEEECHNNGVTAFDVTEEENRTYCTYWKPVL